MEMAEIDAEDKPVQYTDEVKQNAVTHYLFGCVLLRAAKFEADDLANGSKENESMHLS
jgi:hypothetical protein